MSTRDIALQRFPDMPTVGGAPIVESGSNSDGDWSRWADGTQMTYGAKTIANLPVQNALGPLYQTDNQAFPHPMPFLSVSYANAFKSSGAGSLVAVFGSSLLGNRTSDISFRLVAGGSQSAQDTPVVFYAAGYWK